MKEVRVHIAGRDPSPPPHIHELRPGTFFTFETTDHPYLMTGALPSEVHYRSLKTGERYVVRDSLNWVVRIIRPTDLVFEDV